MGYIHEVHAMESTGQNRVAYKKFKKVQHTIPAAAQAYLGSAGVIREHCKQDWPSDFVMRRYCEEQQRKGLEQLKRGKSPRISSKEFQIVRRKCARDWPTDFMMRAYCEEQQFEAVLLGR